MHGRLATLQRVVAAAGQALASGHTYMLTHTVMCAALPLRQNKDLERLSRSLTFIKLAVMY